MLSSVLYELVRATSCTGGAVDLVDPQRTGLLRAARHCEDPEQQSRYPEHLAMVHFINYTEPQPGDQHEDDDDREKFHLHHPCAACSGGRAPLRSSSKKKTAEWSVISPKPTRSAELT